MPSYFLYLSCVLSAKPALDVIQDEITIVNNANGVSLTLEHLGLVESDSRVLTPNVCCGFVLYEFYNIILQRKQEHYTKQK